VLSAHHIELFPAPRQKDSHAEGWTASSRHVAGPSPYPHRGALSSSALRVLPA
jgi:hypothetical protein